MFCYSLYIAYIYLSQFGSAVSGISSVWSECSVWGGKAAGSNPASPTNYVGVAEWLRTGLQIRIMQVRLLSPTPWLTSIL
jgi:hypothetical protein